MQLGNDGLMCHFRSGMFDIHLVTSVSYSDPAPGYVTVAQWERRPGEWLSLLGTAQDRVTQAEQVAAIYSLTL